MIRRGFVLSAKWALKSVSTCESIKKLRVGLLTRYKRRLDSMWPQVLQGLLADVVEATSDMSSLQETLEV